MIRREPEELIQCWECSEFGWEWYLNEHISFLIIHQVVHLWLMLFFLTWVIL